MRAALKLGKKDGRDGQTDRQSNTKPMHVRFPPDAANVLSDTVCDIRDFCWT